MEASTVAHLWLSPGVPHNPVFSSIADSTACSHPNVVDFRRCYIFRVETTSVVIKLVSGHESTTEGNKGKFINIISSRCLVVLMQPLKPDWVTGEDFCHHIFPSTDGSKALIKPPSLVVYNTAFSTNCASPTSIKRSALWN